MPIITTARCLVLFCESNTINSDWSMYHNCIHKHSSASLETAKVQVMAIAMCGFITLVIMLKASAR